MPASIIIVNRGCSCVVTGTNISNQDTGNKVSRKSQIIGTQNIILGGKSVIQAEVIIRGDLVRTLDAPAGTEKKAPVVAVAIGRYCFLSRGCVLKPPGRVMKGYVSAYLRDFLCLLGPGHHANEMHYLGSLATIL